MPASIDVGSNTVRLLIGEVRRGHLLPHKYYRRITRLGGGFTERAGLSLSARERTLAALQEIAEQLDAEGIREIRAVGTEAFRKAVNGKEFAELVRTTTGLPLCIIDGADEARLAARGVHLGLVPIPPSSLIFDLGGGSTEFIFCHNDNLLFNASYPIGVVSLCEETSSTAELQRRIDKVLCLLQADLAKIPFSEHSQSLTLVGTAGTVTTLAALHLRMAEYDWRRVNNLVLDRNDLECLGERLTALSLADRETLPGMEPGRGDLILPGLTFIQSLMRDLGFSSLKVSDFGLLEGLLLEDTDPLSPGD